ncbi:MAG TPA: biotin carboxylase N-terminal domain-containing protein [Solirubrobacteraceae bacterium]|nr:biotin carboxylase N-terminal domain-containing protein [Solirubrobacteraceae bacterium]
MFDTVLIANRGEIARRVIRTLDRLGIASVAVHVDADRDAPHVREATHAVRIESYLDLDAVLGACADSGAQALHPGYGFLSENPALGRACAARGITFVGPPPDAVALMGDKVAAKRAAQRAGVPVVESFDEDAARAAGPDHYPLLVKAAAGGGGRGMRIVQAPDELDAALVSAAREARAGFGDERVFIERFIPLARHLEVQVIADAHGAVLHLGERECSLQRRHQKLVEEAPSPAVTPALRERLGAEAVALAAAAGYVNAGTVEFIADATDPERHWFLEMNARLQVEHPVTELVTGVDLVELQLRVAAGEPLPLTQAEIAMAGHAIEVRVTAEDPARGFLPTAGRVLAYERPGRGGAGGTRADACRRGEQALARVDDAIEVGTEVGTGFDSLLAKVIVHAENRPTALRRMQRALARTTILGLTTSTGYLRELLAHEDVVAGRLDTGLVERVGTLAAPIGERGVAVAAAMLELAERRAEADDDPFARRDGWRLGTERAGSHWRLAVAGGEPVEVELPAAVAATARRVSPGRFAITHRGEWLRAREAPPSPVVWIGHGGRAWPVRPASAHRTEGPAADGRLRAPMPGNVLLVSAAVGDSVRSGDPIVVIESMKMELTLAAPADGTVAELTVAAGDAVILDQPLARIQIDPPPAP